MPTPIRGVASRLTLPPPSASAAGQDPGVPGSQAWRKTRTLPGTRWRSMQLPLASSSGGQDGLGDDDLEGSHHRLARRVERRLVSERVSAPRQVNFIGLPLEEKRAPAGRTVEHGDPPRLLHVPGRTGPSYA